MSDGITLRVDDTQVKTLLDKLALRGKNMRNVMSVIGDIVIGSVDKNFQVGGRYGEVGSWRGGSSNWRALSTTTLLNAIGRNKGFTKGGIGAGRMRARASRTLANKKILIESGHLASGAGRGHATGKTVTSDSVTVGTNVEYAAIHNFGGQAGRGRKVMIPARPFLVVQDEDITEMKSVIGDHLLDNL
jgi:phage gpG-like protein